MLMTMSAQPVPQSFFTPNPSPSRKRHAVDPPPFAFDLASPHREKRKRPNLSHGFSGLNLHGQAAAYPNEDASSEGSLSPSRSKREVSVEEIQDTRPYWSIPNHASSSHSSTSSDEETPRHAKKTRKSRQPAVQQPDAVEQPDDIEYSTNNNGGDVDVQDVSELSPFRPKKRRGRDEDAGMHKFKRQRQADGMDVDMSGEMEEDIEEIPRSRPKTRTQWHEPEKDRIVITSLGSPDSSRASSRSPSPDPFQDLSQPGTQGFTLHPSLLTHLLNSQRSDMFPHHQPAEKGLVLYRPLGIEPGSVPDVVRQWQGQPVLQETDASRFEELDDDEHTAMDTEMQVDDAMDIE